MARRVFSLNNLRRGFPLWYRQEGHALLSSTTGRWVKRILFGLSWLALLELAYVGGKVVFPFMAGLFHPSVGEMVAAMPWVPTGWHPAGLVMMLVGGVVEAVLGWLLYSTFNVLRRICYLGSLLEPEHVGDLF